MYTAGMGASPFAGLPAMSPGGASIAPQAVQMLQSRSSVPSMPMPEFAPPPPPVFTHRMSFGPHIDIPPELFIPRRSPFSSILQNGPFNMGTASIGGMDAAPGPMGADAAAMAAATAIASGEAQGALGGQVADNPSSLGAPSADTAAGQLSGSLGGLTGDAPHGQSSGETISGGESSNSGGHGGIGDGLGGSGPDSSGGQGNSSGDDAGGFRLGGQFQVIGAPGADRTMVGFPATPGEQVIVVPPGQAPSQVAPATPGQMQTVSQVPNMETSMMRPGMNPFAMMPGGAGDPRAAAMAQRASMMGGGMPGGGMQQPMSRPIQSPMMPPGGPMGGEPQFAPPAGPAPSPAGPMVNPRQAMMGASMGTPGPHDAALAAQMQAMQELALQRQLMAALGLPFPVDPGGASTGSDDAGGFGDSDSGGPW